MSEPPAVHQPAAVDMDAPVCWTALEIDGKPHVCIRWPCMEHGQREPLTLREAVGRPGRPVHRPPQDPDTPSAAAEPHPFRQDMICADCGLRWDTPLHDMAAQPAAGGTPSPAAPDRGPPWWCGLCSHGQTPAASCEDCRAIAHDLELQTELDKLEATDPAVAAAARSYDEMVERVTAAGGTPSAAGDERCPSCEHSWSHHSEPGCWFTVVAGRPGKDNVCACSLLPVDGSCGRCRLGDTILACSCSERCGSNICLRARPEPAPGGTPTVADTDGQTNECRRCNHPAHAGRRCGEKWLARPLVRVHCTCGGATEFHPFVPGEQAWDSVEEVRWGPPLCAHDRCHQREDHPLHTPPAQMHESSEQRSEQPAGPDVDTRYIAAVRADARSHPSRPHPYCPSCVDAVVRLADALDARDAEIRKLRAEVARLNEFGESLAHQWADNAIEQRDDARARLDEIRALHREAKDERHAWCVADGRPWPCPTIAVMDREPSDG